MPKATQSLIIAAIAYCRCTPWTFYHHKIALNHSFPTVPVSLNLAQRLLRYKPIFACTPHVHQLLINDIMLHYGWTLWTLLHHKIALNRSFPTVLFILNLVEQLQSYNQIFGRTLHGPSMDPHGPSVGNGFFSLSFDSMDMKLIRSER